MVLSMFFVFAVVFLALTVGAVYFVVRCFMKHTLTTLLISVPGLFMVYVFGVLTLYFVRRIIDLV